jgi:hypothetical protein
MRVVIIGGLAVVNAVVDRIRLRSCLPGEITLIDMAVACLSCWGQPTSLPGENLLLSFAVR